MGARTAGAGNPPPAEQVCVQQVQRVCNSQRCHAHEHLACMALGTCGLLFVSLSLRCIQQGGSGQQHLACCQIRHQSFCRRPHTWQRRARPAHPACPAASSSSARSTRTCSPALCELHPEWLQLHSSKPLAWCPPHPTCLPRRSRQAAASPPHLHATTCRVTTTRAARQQGQPCCSHAAT